MRAQLPLEREEQGEGRDGGQGPGGAQLVARPAPGDPQGGQGQDRGQDPQALIPPLAQRELAAIAGLSRETTSRTFAQLRDRGIVIGDPQGMRIADLQALKKRGLLA